jgi:ADP-L-glycero-D-manno-heptose 6-epimerase
MIVLTGGAGFIGSAFLSKLNSQGLSDIIVVDELDTTEKWKNLVGKEFCDYLHKDQFLSLIENGKLGEVKKVIHLGACSSTTERDAEYMMQNNFCYSKKVAQWALRNGSRFIYASSAATYGNGEHGFSDTIDSPEKLSPLNVYALSKQQFDLWAIRSGAVDKMTGIKFFNVFGPNEYHKGDMCSVISKAYHQIKEKGSIELFKSYRDDYADGEQKRDFIYIKDCNEVLWWFLENEICGIFNLGTGQARSWNDLAKAVFGAMGEKENISYIEMPESLRGKYQYFTQAEMDKLSSASCPHQFSSLEDSVQDYVRSYLAKGVGTAESYL